LRAALDADEALGAAALLATLAAAGVAGTFDAVLLLALPSFFVWTIVGALYPSTETPRTIRGAKLVVLLLVAMGVVRSASQLAAMHLYATHSDRATLEFASRLDPGSYKLHLRLAQRGKQRCGHARAAHALYPQADAARRLARECDTN
jgi:hypothetical protein